MISVLVCGCCRAGQCRGEGVEKVSVIFPQKLDDSMTLTERNTRGIHEKWVDPLFRVTVEEPSVLMLQLIEFNEEQFPG